MVTWGWPFPHTPAAVLEGKTCDEQPTYRPQRGEMSVWSLWVGKFFLKNLRPGGDRSTRLKLEKPRAREAGDLSPKSGKKWTFSLPFPLPALPLPQLWDQVHSHPKTESWHCILPFSSPPPASGGQKRSWATLSGAPFVTALNRLGLAFKRQLGLGTMFHFLTPLIGLWVRAVMKTSLGVSCNCPGKCTHTGPKATEGGRVGQICFVYGARMATDKRSVPWDSSVDRPTVFSAVPRGP